MAVDLERILRAAAQAALEDGESDRGGQRRSGKRKAKLLSGPRAILIGAGLFTAGRVLARGRGQGLVDRLQQRLAELEDGDVEGPEDDVEDDVDLDEDEAYDEPVDEEDEHVDEDDEPVDEEDEAYDEAA